MSYEVSLDIPNIDALLDKVRTVGREMGFIEREVSRVGQSAARETSRISSAQGYDPSSKHIATAHEQSELSFASRAYREDKQSVRNQINSIAGQIEDSFTGKAPKITGPSTRLDRATEAIDYLKTYGGTQSEFNDAQRMYDRAQRQVNGPTMQDRFNDMVGTTRLNLGGASPLINRMAGMLPGGMAAAGPIAAAVAVTAMAKSAADTHAQTQREYATAYYTGGGGSAQMIGMGALLGQSPAELARESIRFGDTLREGGYGAAYFRSKGLYDTGVYQTDKASNYGKALRMIADEQNEGLAVRVARDAGLSDKLWLRDLDKNRRESVISGAEGLGSKAARRSAANYEASKAEWEMRWAGIQQEAGDFTTRFGTHAADTGFLSPTLAMAWTLGESLYGRIKNSYFSGDDKPKGSAPGKNRAPGQMDWGPNVGRAPADESFGGIGMDPNRYRGAVPAGWKYLQMDEALSGQAKNLGAFTY